MNIAVIDADLIGIGNHRFPNLAAMKISAFHKSQGDHVILKMDYENLEQYDKVYISKVFIDTEIPMEKEDKVMKNEETVGEYYSDHPLLCLPNVEYGGTGFFYDKALPLPTEIEHIMPDYHLYDDVVNDLIVGGASRKSLEYYLDFSIGFATRGCIRGCDFCVNRNYKKCIRHSLLILIVHIYVVLTITFWLVRNGKRFFMNCKQLENGFSLSKDVTSDF